MAANVANFSGARHGPEIELLLCGEGEEKWRGGGQQCGGTVGYWREGERDTNYLRVLVT